MKRARTKDVEDLLQFALNGGALTHEGIKIIWEQAPTADLMRAAHQRRLDLTRPDIVTWIIDRNSNTTNVCVANCKFCNFYRRPGHEEAYVTTIEEYDEKITEMFELGGEQLLLQGGHHPDLGLDFYTDLFRTLKQRHPRLKLHALGPPEIAHIAKLEQTTHTEVLTKLKDAGLDSLPGAGAEILADRVRRLISKGKCSGEEWLDVMRAAHQLDITTSATMMFGHIETDDERIDHLLRLRAVQDEKPKAANGFLAFIPWPFMDEGTLLKRIKRARNTCTMDEYVRMIALCRLTLNNITNIQASWLTVGKATGQICLHAGANDFGSIMIEENVVSVAGAPYRFTADGIQQAIREAGFTPQLRDQLYRDRELPTQLRQQKIMGAHLEVD